MNYKIRENTISINNTNIDAKQQIVEKIRANRVNYVQTLIPVLLEMFRGEYQVLPFVKGKPKCNKVADAKNERSFFAPKFPSPPGTRIKNAPGDIRRLLYK
jgi:hypothetical protein